MTSPYGWALSWDNFFEECKEIPGLRFREDFRPDFRFPACNCGEEQDPPCCHFMPDAIEDDVYEGPKDELQFHSYGIVLHKDYKRPLSGDVYQDFLDFLAQNKEAQTAWDDYHKSKEKSKKRKRESSLPPLSDTDDLPEQDDEDDDYTFLASDNDTDTEDEDEELREKRIQEEVSRILDQPWPLTSSMWREEDEYDNNIKDLDLLDWKLVFLF